MAAPGWRGDDFQVPTTVPIPMVSPAAHHRVRSSITSRTTDHLHKMPQRVERMPGDELVHVRQGRHHTSGDRGEAVLASVWVDPDDAVREAGESLHLLAEQLRVAALPAVAGDDDDRAPGRPTLAPEVEEGAQRLAKAGAAAPVG